MTAYIRPIADFTPEQLRFPPAAGYTVRADFAGGEISSDLGAQVASLQVEKITKGTNRRVWSLCAGGGFRENPISTKVFICQH